MRIAWGLALFLVAAALFLVANRGAYEGYFQADELDNIGWAPEAPLQDYLTGILSPRFFAHNFRPAGHFYFHAAGRAFGLDFPPYVAVVHALHLLNVWLLWRLARRLGASRLAASSAALFLAFHMALFDAYWKPMYVFDVLCATFSLACLLAWSHRRWVLSFAAFWLAYKSKELAVMLPLVLAAGEWWFGKRSWKPLLPFFAASLGFGLQGVLLNPHREGEYSFQFTPQALGRTVQFYASRLLLAPFAGLLVLALPALVRDRRVWFGITGMLALFVPLAFLPGRMFSAYCYLPLALLAVAVAGVADSRWRPAVALFFIAWIPWNFLLLRLHRRQALAIAYEHRAYVGRLAPYVRSRPALRSFVYDGRPFNLPAYGIQGALRALHGGEVLLAALDEPEGARALAQPPVALLVWDAARAELNIVERTAEQPDASYVEMSRTPPVWQFGPGWYPVEGAFRWAQPVATARLFRPAGARRFEVVINVGPDQLRDLGSIQVRARVGGHELPPRALREKGWRTVAWDLPPAPPGTVEIELHSPPYRPSSGDSRSLGLAVVAFGFVTR